MTTKRYTVENLGCANCAAKMEAKMNALPGVEATLTFATRQLRITAEDPDALLSQLQTIVSSIEPEAVITPQAHTHHHARHEHHEGCTCGHEHHEHDHHEGCSCGHHHHHDHHEGCSCGHHHHHDHHEDCSCGHHHHHHEEAGHDHHAHSGEGKALLMGGGLFVLGLALDWLGASLFGLRLSLLAYIAAYILLGMEVLLTAGKNLLRGHVFDENFLMSLATLGAFVIGEFPEAVGVMLFYRVGEYFEHRAVERSRSQIMEAVDLRPETVNLLRDGHTEVIPTGDAVPGDLLLVRPGDRIPLDAVVVTGRSRIDTSPVTGEPVPVTAGPGDAVISGCVNTDAQLTVKVEKPLSESMVTRILDAVENAAAGKPKIDRFITRFARVYTPVVVSAAVLTAVVPSLITGDWNYWVYTALSFLVMSCPCALVLSVPLAFFSGIGVGSKRGILFKGGLSIEALAGVKAVAMDKTGTVTKGDFRVQKIEGPEDLLRLCAGAEQNSTHPIAMSIVAAARERGLALPVPEALEEHSGCGISCTVEGRRVLCGNGRLMDKFGVSFPAVSQSGTTVLVAADGKYMGYILISDTLKPDARAAVEELKSLGIHPAMLTGDTPDSAQAVANTAGIREVYPKLLPQDKLTVLQALRGSHGSTMFVGDGINDAPVLAGADVGAAMGSGADAAIEAADVVFMTSEVRAIPDSIRIARSTRQIAWQNVIFALAVKAIVMVLGLMGYASMWLAVFADSGVAMLCVLNSIRLLYRKS